MDGSEIYADSPECFGIVTILVTSEATIIRCLRKPEMNVVDVHTSPAQLQPRESFVLI